MALAPTEPSIELGSDGQLNATAVAAWSKRARWLLDSSKRGVKELAFTVPAGVGFSLTGGTKNGQEAFGTKIEWTHCIGRSASSFPPEDS